MKYFVLLLVAIAAGGLFFVLKSDSGTTEPETEVSRNDDTAPRDPAPTNDVEDLAAVGDGASRKEGEVEAAPTVVEPTSAGPEFASLGAGSLTGLVVDGKETPVAGATVTLTKYGRDSFFFDEIDRSQDVEAKTGSDGRFSFENVPAYEGYSLIASHPEYGKTEVPGIIVQDGVDHETPPIVLEPGVKLSGRIMDTGGNAVPGAKVVLSQNLFVAAMAENTDDSIETETDGQGYYEFLNVTPQQNYGITVTADGYGRVNESPIAVIEGEDTVQDLTLEVASMLGGVILSTDGEPIEGATIQAYLMDRSRPRTFSKAQSDEEGVFEVDDIPPGRYQIVARHPRFTPKTNTQAETGEMQIAIELQPLPVVTGRVVDLSTGQPVTSFVAQLRQPVPGSQDGLTTAVPASRASFEHPDGQFELIVPKGGDYMVEAIANGFADTYSDTFTTTVGADTSGVTVRMTRGGTLIGRVLADGGGPVAGATVTTHDKEWSDDLFWRSLGSGAPGNATEKTVRTKDDGTFEIPNLTPANYKLVIKHRDFAQETVKDLSVAEGQEARVGDVILPRGATITGQVLGPSGSPMAGATVKMFPTTLDAGHYQAQTDKNGEYLIKNVREGSYKIHATRPRGGANGSPFQENVDMKNTQTAITVVNGQPLDGINFKLSDR